MSFALRILVCSVLVVLSVADVRTRRLPNRWIAAIAMLYFVNAALAQSPWTVVGMHVLTGLACFGVAACLFALGWMGGGDVKLAGAIALWTGVKLVGVVFVVTSVAGLVLALATLAARAWPRRAPSTPGGAQSAERGVPYGVALAAGGFAGILLPWLLHG